MAIVLSVQVAPAETLTSIIHGQRLRCCEGVATSSRVVGSRGSVGACRSASDGKALLASTFITIDVYVVYWLCAVNDRRTHSRPAAASCMSSWEHRSYRAKHLAPVSGSLDRTVGQ